MAWLSAHNIAGSAKLKALQDRLAEVEGMEAFDPTAINGDLSTIQQDLDAVEVKLNAGLVIPVLATDPVNPVVGRIWMIDGGGA